MTTSLLQRVLGLVAAAAVTLASNPVQAGPAKAEPAKAPAAAPAASPTGGKTIALLRFSGLPRANELRGDIQNGFESNGFTVKGVALDLDGAAKKVKCRAAGNDPSCLDALGKWLNSNPKTAADFIVFGSVTEGKPPKADVVVYDIAQQKVVEDVDAVLSEQDLILPIVLPQRLATAVEQHRTPPPPATAEEQATIAALDEPEKTPEEIAAEQKALAELEDKAAQARADQRVDTGDIAVDLRDDFKDFCRTGPRKKRETKDDPKDLRPKCQRGPVFGYWQPRAYVALVLTSAAAITTAAFYGAALAARSPYKKAVDRLDAFKDDANGDPTTNPNAACNDGVCYDELATDVSRTGAVMRRRAIVGDVMLGATVLLGGVLGIIIWQDRHDAKEFIRQEKGLRAIADFNFGPILTRETKGAGMGFKF